MDIDKLTIGEARQIAQAFGGAKAIDNSAWDIGKIYLIRTVTMIDLGRVVAVTEHEIVLEDACWIADTGRFSDALKGGSWSETEPFPDGRVIIGRGAVIDAAQVSSVVRSKK